jgi:2-polyprenyl-3-methyl-5-hydroxy-6-metoxy-1,4-benzoquinol methylase
MLPDKTKLHPKGSVEKQYLELERDLKFYLTNTGNQLDANKVEAVDCSLCGKKADADQLPEFVKFLFPYIKCTSCGLVYPSPRPKHQYIEKQYIDGRFSTSFDEIYLPSAKYRMETIFKERVEELIKPRTANGKLLDIGCSSGHFLKVASDSGYDAFGIEPNQKMVEFATNDLGLNNISQGTTDTVTLQEEYFDIVTMWDVIEHVPEPSKLLEFAMKSLKPGGWLFAYTENYDSFNYFINGKYSEMFGADVHLRHYTPETFRKEFSDAGFIVRELYTKGLDIQHIRTIIDVYKGAFEGINFDFLFSNSDDMQEMINSSGKGDNLRLFAQKSD